MTDEDYNIIIDRSLLLLKKTHVIDGIMEYFCCNTLDRIMLHENTKKQTIGLLVKKVGFFVLWDYRDYIKRLDKQ